MNMKEPTAADVFGALVRLILLWITILLTTSTLFWLSWNRSVSPVFGLCQITHAEAVCGLICLWVVARYWRGIPVSLPASEEKSR
jgi:hypothetical protein